jgi:Spy/CpxP family protein refolding chaperone
MKTLLSARRVGFLALALATASVTATFAQTTPTTTSTTTPAAPTCTAGGEHHHGSVLTAAEKAQLKTARDEAFATDPSLKADADSLKQQFESLKSAGDSATVDQKKALHAQARDFHQKMQAAELKLDPTLAPVLAKLNAMHRHGHHHDSSSAT